MKYPIALLFIILQIQAIAQEEFEAALIPSNAGAVIVYTSDERAFTVALNADSIQSFDQPNFVDMDGWILQSFILGFNNPKNKNLGKERNAKEALSQYITFEMDYFKDELKFQNLDPVFEWGKLNDLYCFFWYFDTPPELESLEKQLFLTTICYNQFLNLNIPLEKDKNFDEAKELLMDIGRQISFHDHPIDFQSFYSQLNE